MTGSLAPSVAQCPMSTPRSRTSADPGIVHGKESSRPIPWAYCWLMVALAGFDRSATPVEHRAAPSRAARQPPTRTGGESPAILPTILAGLDHHLALRRQHS